MSSNPNNGRQVSAATNPKVQEYTISHTGSVLGDENVELSNNQTNPQMDTPIIGFTCPRKFEWIELNARNHPTRMVPRTVETVSGDGTTTTFDVNADLMPIHGQETVEDQDFPVIRVVSVANGTEMNVADVDYAANTVTLETAPADGTDNVKFYPVITTGQVKYRGINQFGQVEGVISDWGTPIYRFADFEQNKRGEAIRLHGNVRWDHYETVQMTLDSPHELVWQDDDYPESYVSTFDQRVNIRL